MLKLGKCTEWIQILQKAMCMHDNPTCCRKPYACMTTQSAADNADEQSMHAVSLSKLGSSIQMCTLCGLLYTSSVHRGILARHWIVHCSTAENALHKLCHWNVRSNEPSANLGFDISCLYTVQVAIPT